MRAIGKNIARNVARHVARGGYSFEEWLQNIIYKSGVGFKDVGIAGQAGLEPVLNDVPTSIFNGIDDGVASKADGNYSNDDFSLSIWAKFTSATNYILSQANNDPYSSNFIFLQGANIFWYKGVTVGLVSTENVNDGEWHLLTMVWYRDSLTYKGFVDGYSIGTSAPVGATYGYGPIALGARADFQFGFFDGELHDARFYTRILSDNEVLDLYESREVSSDNIVFKYPLQEFSGNKIWDSSGNENHGTGSGSGQWGTRANNIFSYNQDLGFKVVTYDGGKEAFAPLNISAAEINAAYLNVTSIVELIQDGKSLLGDGSQLATHQSVNNTLLSNGLTVSQALISKGVELAHEIEGGEDASPYSASVTAGQKTSNIKLKM